MARAQARAPDFLDAFESMFLAGSPDVVAQSRLLLPVLLQLLASVEPQRVRAAAEQLLSRYEAARATIDATRGRQATDRVGAQESDWQWRSMEDRRQELKYLLQRMLPVHLTATPATQSITAGQSTSFTIAVQRTNFTAAVDLTISGLPVGATAAFGPDPTTGDGSMLTINTTANTAPGTSMLTISGTALGVTIAPITVSLTVRAAVPPPAPQVKLSASPTQLSVVAGQSVRCTIAIGRTNFTAPVNLSLGAILPAGLSPAFSANPAPGDSSVLTFNASAEASPGTYNVSINATAPGIAIAPIPLTLKAAAPPPSITGFTPTSGPANTTVTISGNNFAGATEVKFNGRLATFTLASRNSIAAFVPYL